MNNVQMNNVKAIFDNRCGHPKNRYYLQKDVDVGKNQFTPIIEVIRMLHLNTTDNGRLVIDFIKFRDILAHKDVANIRLLQMVTAFVMYCREKLEYEKISNSPASTDKMPKTFARMADINVVICATWIFNLLSENKIGIDKTSRWLNLLVKNSTFDGFKFTVQDQVIDVSYTPNKEKLDENSFSIEWLRALTKKVIESPVTYNVEEVQEFKDCIKIATNAIQSSNSEDEVKSLIEKCDIAKNYIKSNSSQFNVNALKKLRNEVIQVVQSSANYCQVDVKTFERHWNEVANNIEVRIYTDEKVKEFNQCIENAKKVIISYLICREDEVNALIRFCDKAKNVVELNKMYLFEKYYNKVIVVINSSIILSTEKVEQIKEAWCRAKDMIESSEENKSTCITLIENAKTVIES